MELFPSFKISEGLTPSEDSQKPFAPLFQSVEYKLSTIVEKISNIDNLNENEIKNIILRQHSMILNYDLFLKSDESRAHAQKLFTNKRFLQIFLDVIGLLELTREEIICVNKLAYDYHILPEKDPDISNLFMSISNQINNVMVIRLSGILGINGARVLSMIANSSFKEEKNIHRVNTFLVKCNIALSVLNIVDIYCILYERFTYPFIYTMLETNDNLNDEQKKRFDYISLAILSMLDSMTLKNIKIVLANYAYTIKLYPNITKVRFSLKSATNYPRILKVIDEIEHEGFEELYIP